MESHKGISFLISAAAFVVIIAGMQAAASILVPFLLAAFIAIICLPPLRWFIAKGLSPASSVFILTFLIVALGMLTGAFVGASIADFTNNLALYQERLQQQTGDLITWLSGLGISLDTHMLREHFDPSIAMDMAGNLLAGLGNALTNTFLIVLTVIFLLIEMTALPHKWSAMDGKAPAIESFEQFADTVSSYFAIKTWISLVTAVLITIWLMILGVDYAPLWGLIAFLFNFVPNIGSIIAAIPAVLLALVQLGVGDAVLAGLGFIMVNIVMGNVIEPRFMGRGIGLSTLVVFLSLIFWGWVLGPVGMLLSVPLTMIVKIALETRAETRWLAILIGPDIDSGEKHSS